ncbi:helix-turn-helix domain-containing protein [Brevibacillus laterosporus]|uniref:Helix-turn-helix transcriptional regulator n=1 Tax=Brevibacillus halotolerans TaxID=1507437 RepID=A0ABT4HZM4_9BACL|nr:MULTISPECIES: helix-turn-helix transcriptional regulator [Brevibacillus]MCR8986019.1 helix-turn-helix domain-containing protein [Brevibacillus laterosporus]MCZ0831752.1 helix-turn-helix transcriptional regulator [Brevibacillus halotolerans]
MNKVQGSSENTDLKKRIGERIKTQRTEAGLYQSHLAERVGVDRVSISNYETGRAMPPWDIIVALAEVLNCTTDYLLCKTDINLYDWIPSPTEEAQKKRNSDPYKNEKEFLANIDLSDEDLRKKFKVVMDGRELTEKEWKKLVAFLRLERDLD